MDKKERRKLRRQKRQAKREAARRLTEAGALELAIAVAQYFYYELDDPIMSDSAYDELERRYIHYRRASKSPGGVTPDIMKVPGSGESLRKWILEWRKGP